MLSSTGFLWDTECSSYVYFYIFIIVLVVWQVRQNYRGLKCEHKRSCCRVGKPCDPHWAGGDPVSATSHLWPHCPIWQLWYDTFGGVYIIPFSCEAFPYQDDHELWAKNLCIALNGRLLRLPRLSQISQHRRISHFSLLWHLYVEGRYFRTHPIRVPLLLLFCLQTLVKHQSVAG